MSAPTKLSRLLPWGVAVVFGLAALGQLERVELPFSRAIYLHEVIASLVVALGIFILGRRVVLSKKVTGLNIWVLLSVGWEGIRGLGFISPLFYLLRFDLYLAFASVLVRLVQTKLLSRRFLAFLLIGSVTMIAVLGWLQYFLIPDTRALQYLGWDNHYLRLISTLFDPGFTGAVMVIGILTVMKLLMTWGRRLTGNFLILQICLITLLGAVLFTYSRASYLALAAGVIMLALKTRKWGWLIILPLFGLAILLLPRPASEGARLERTASITARLVADQAAQPGSLTEVVLGKGWYAGKNEKVRVMDGSVISSHNSAPDNSFLFVFTAVGLVGLGLFLWLLKTTAQVGQASALTLAVLLSVSTHALFSNTWLYPFILLFVGGVIALEAKADISSGDPYW